jgi:N-acetylmuramoyl-L-alanine amidase
MARWIQDAGHGGIDPGAVANGQQEKVWTLEAALYINGRLNALGISSGVTRSKDMTLDSEERTKIVRNSGAVYCLSHHFNAGGGEGVETIHSIHSSNVVASKIANYISDVGMKFRKVFTRKLLSGKDYYYMHRDTGKVQTVIIEYGFLDNKYDYSKLKNSVFRHRLYEAVVKAVCEIESTPYSPTEIKHVKTLYKVQVGAFADKENAQRLSKELQNKGYKTIIVEE